MTGLSYAFGGFQEGLPVVSVTAPPVLVPWPVPWPVSVTGDSPAPSGSKAVPFFVLGFFALKVLTHKS